MLVEPLEDRRLLAVISAGGSGKLLITDAAGENNDLRIQSDTANNKFIIRDAANVLNTTFPGSTQVDPNTVEVPFGLFGNGFQINPGGGDDHLTVDYSLGNFSQLVRFIAGPEGPNGDSLSLEGGGTFAAAVFNFTNNSDGTIDVAGNRQIIYQDLEPITSTITVSDVTLNFNGGAETIDVADNGATLTVDSTAGEVLTLNEPTNSLAIDAGSDLDVLNFVNPFAMGGAVAVTSETININGGSVNAGSQTYHGDVGLGANTTLLGGAVTVNGRLDGPFALTANTAGTKVFGGEVGGVTPLSSISVTGAGTAELRGGAITAVGNVVVLSNILLDSPTNLTSITAGGTVGFGSASSNFLRSVTDGEDALEIASPGVIRFNARVGNNGQRLASLTTGGAGETQFAGVEVNTTGDQTYGNKVTAITNGYFFHSDTGDITFASTVDGSNGLIITTAGSTTFGSAIGSLTAPTRVTIVNSHDVTFDGSVTADLVEQWSGTGNTTFNSSVSAGNVDINTAGTVAFNAGIIVAAIGGIDVNAETIDVTAGLSTSGVAPVRLTAARDIVMNGGSSVITTGGAITLSANRQAIATAGNFDGVLINGTVQSTTGRIHVTGKSGDDLLNNGVSLLNGGISSPGTAEIVIEGSSVGADKSSNGVFLSRNISTDGDIRVTGDSNLGKGVVIHRSNLSTGGAGNITLNGVGPASNNFAAGVFFSSSTGSVTTVDGDINIEGDSSGQFSVALNSSRTIQSTSGGNISVIGHTSLVTSSGSDLLTADGDITVNGPAISFSDNAEIASSGVGDITLQGTGAGTVVGVFSPATLGVASGTGLITVTVDASTAKASITGVIDGSGGFTNNGPGTVILGTANAYTGATIAADGTLLVNGATTSGSPVTVKSGATLGGSGSVGGTVSVEAGGSVAPGQSPGILPTGDVEFASGSTYDVEIGGPSAGNTANDHDQLLVTGAVDIDAGATLNLSSFNGYVPTSTDSFTIIDNDGTDGVTGSFAGLPESMLLANFLGSGTNKVITYAGGDGNDVVILPAPELTISDAQVVEGSGAGTVDLVFTVTRSHNLTNVSVDVSTSDLLAQAGSDYAGLPATLLNFVSGGALSQDVIVSVASDDIVELDETLEAILANALGAVISDGAATGTILNDDSATVSIADASVTEGGDLQFAVSLSNPVDVDTVISYSTNDGTADGTDYAGVSGTLTIPAGQTSGTISVATIADNTVELDETITLHITGVEASGRSVVLEGVFAQPVSAWSAEGDTTDSVGNNDGTLFAGAGFTAGVNGGQAFDFRNNNGYVAIPNDPSLSPSEITVEAWVNLEPSTFQTTLSYIISNGGHVPFNSLTGWSLGIAGNWDGPFPSVGGSKDTGKLFVFDGSGPSNGAGHVAWTDIPLTLQTWNHIAFTNDGSTTSIYINGELAGSGPQTLPVPNGPLTFGRRGDGLAPMNGRLDEVQLYGRVLTADEIRDRYNGVTASTVTGTILNDDNATVSIADASVTEGGNLQFAVSLSNPVDVDTVISYSTSDGTADSSDYTGVSGTLTIPAGQTTGTISVATTDDNTVELDETVSLNLTDVQAGGRDVVASATALADVIHHWAGDGDATDSVGNNDGTLFGNATFAPGQTGQAFSFDGNDDAIRFGTAVLGTTDPFSIDAWIKPNNLSTYQSIVSEIGGDNVEGQYQFRLRPGGQIDFFRRNGNGSRADAITTSSSVQTGVWTHVAAVYGGGIDFRVYVNGVEQPGTYKPNDNYNGIGTAETRIGLGDSTRWDFNGLIDEVRLYSTALTGEQVTQLFTGASAAQATGTIVNDDTATVSIGDAQVVEGGNLEFPVTLSNPVDVDTVVTYSTADVTATTGDNDYSGATNQTITILAGDTTGMISVATGNDNTVERDESLDVTLSDLQTGKREVGFSAFREAGGIVVGEAEHFSERNTGPFGDQWLVVPDESASTGGTFLNARNDQFVQALPDGGTGGFSSDPDRQPHLDFDIEITTGGLYQLYARGGRFDNNSDSMFASIVEQKDGAGGNADWYRITPTVNLDFGASGWRSVGEYEGLSAFGNDVPMTWALNPGVYTLRFTYREDGVALDAWALQSATLPAPAGIGPAETAAQTRTATGTILNDDTATISIADAQVIEGDSGTTQLVFDVTLDNDVAAAISLDYDSSDGTAQVGDSDYTAASGTLNFAGFAGEVQQIIIDVSGDTKAEANETLQVALSNLGAGGLVGAVSLGGAAVGAGGPQSVFANVAEAASYSLVYDFAIPDSADFNGGSVPYTTDNSGSIADGSFDRIAYYMELDDGSGVQYVYVSVDAFTAVAGETGVPVTTQFEQFLTGMNIESNVPGIVTGTNLNTGNIEFWHNCYGTGANSGVPGASGGVYDFDDDSNATANCYGSMQIHNYGAAQTLFAYNRWEAGGTSDLGIGNSTSAHPDWTFTSSAAGYTVKNLQVLVRQANAATATGTIIDDDTIAVHVNDVSPINENGSATLTGTVTGVGTTAPFELLINWGDPLSPNNQETVSFPASTTGSTSFTLTHQYLDDNPTATAADNYDIRVGAQKSNAAVADQVVLSTTEPAATLDWDAAVDGDGNSVWASTANNSAATEWNLGSNRLPADVSGSNFTGVNKAYRFDASNPGATMASWQNMGFAGTNPTNQDATFEVTFRPDDLSGSHVLLESGGNGDGMIVKLEENELVFRVQRFNPGGTANDTFVEIRTELPAAGVFYQFLGTIDLTNDEASVYLNGELVETQAVRLRDTGLPGGNMTDWAGGDGSSLSIAGSGAAGGNPGFTQFEGDIARVRYFRDQVLTAADVADSYHVRSRLTDTDVTVTNVDPILVLNPVADINENGFATLTGTITDPGTLDVFTLDIDWGDPLSPNNVETYTISADASGVTTFSLTHQYLDDNPTATSSDQYTIHAAVKDDDGSSYILGGPAWNLTSGSGGWGWDTSGLASPNRYIDAVDGYRGAIADPAFFGTSGVVDTTIVTTNLQTIDASALSSLDGFAATWWQDSQTTTAAANAVIDFFQAGGDLILLQDDANHDRIGELLGIPTSGGANNLSNGTSPLYVGPFGSATDVQPRGNIGQVLSGDIAARGGQIGGTNASGQVTAAYWEEGQYIDPNGNPHPNSGRLVIVADTEFFSTWLGNTSYYPLDDNGIFALNATAFAIDSLTDNSSASTTVTVHNVAPTVTLDPVANIDENGFATLTGTITDPGTLDVFTLDIDWGDPLSPSNTEAYTFGASATGSQTFTLTHQYLDDNPTNTPLDAYTISATVMDDDGGNSSPEDFVTETFATISTQVRGMDFGPGGAFGNDLYVSTATDILRVSNTGAVSTFVTGLSGPNGIAFSDGGAFGTNLYVLEYGTDTILSIDASGVVSTFASHVNFRDLDDLTFGPGTGGFSTNLYVSDGGFPGAVPGRIFEVTPSGTVSQFAANNGMTSAGIAFASGSGFGAASLILADSLNHAGNDGSLRSYASDGSSSVIINAGPSALFNPGDVVQGPGGAFGNDLFVSDWTSDAIYQLTAGGTLTEFSAGRPYANWIDADLLFSPDGTALYTSEGANGTITRIRLSSTPATTSVTVNNVAPTVTLDPVADIDENGTAVLTGTITDVGTLDTFTVVIDWNAGGNVGGPGEGTTTLNHGDLTFVSPGVYTFSTSHQYLDDNPTGSAQDTYTINATVTDDDTLSGDDSTTVLVSNVAPVIAGVTSGAEACGAAHEDDPITLDLSFDDIGSLDVHTVVIDWGDSNVDTVVLSAGHRLLSIDHEYATGGIYTVSVTVADDDGESDAASLLAVVSGVGLHGGVLQIIGTGGDDHVTLNQTGNGLLKVHADWIVEHLNDDTRDFQLDDIDRIFMLLCDGNDHANVSSRIVLDTIIDGGAGDDHLNGGDGSNVILGREGNDHINGGSGRDILIGGEGIDRIVGNAERDLISGGLLRNTTNGETDSIADEGDLLTAQARWQAATDAEIDAWRAGTDDFFAGLDLEIADDGDIDQLTGSSADDWFSLVAGDSVTDASSNGNGNGGTNNGKGRK